jgi:RNA polymerase sigma-70 factor (ECF subfamily)
MPDYCLRRLSQYDAADAAAEVFAEAWRRIDSVPNGAVRRAEDARVIRAMGALKEDDREVLRLKLWEELSHADIRAILGVSAHAVDMRVRRATKRLGKRLGPSSTLQRRAIAEGGEA